MTWKEFADLSKSVFVEVATDEFGLGGRPTNVSRVSILTGISRKEVKRVRDLLGKETPQVSGKTTDATRLLSGWHQDAEFTDQNGQPLPLTVDGASPNFSELFRLYGGDTPEQTMLRELTKAGAVEADNKGRVVAKSRYFMPGALSESNLRLLGVHLGSHAKTLKNNIAGGPESVPQIEGIAIDDRIHRDHVDTFKSYLDERGEKFLEEIDDWLSRHRIDESDENAAAVQLGAGVYAIKGSPEKGKRS